MSAITRRYGNQGVNQKAERFEVKFVWLGKRNPLHNPKRRISENLACTESNVSPFLITSQKWLTMGVWSFLRELVRIAMPLLTLPERSATGANYVVPLG
jgi:hypothetical protein